MRRYVSALVSNGYQRGNVVVLGLYGPRGGTAGTFEMSLDQAVSLRDQLTDALFLMAADKERETQ